MKTKTPDDTQRKERKELFNELLAAFNEGLTIRNGECRTHFEKDEPCEVCSQWDSESGSCGVANKLNAVLKKLEDTKDQPEPRHHD